MTDENLLIKKAIEGDQESFEKIVNFYKNYVFAIILNFIKDKEEVENVAQEVFLQIYLSLPKYKEDNFKAWISRITSNKAIDSLRLKRSKFREEVTQEEDQLEKFYIGSDKDPLTEIIERENTQELDDIIGSLPEI